MSYIDGEREKLTIGRLLLYGVCAVVFGFFLLVNLYACVAPYILLAQKLAD